MVCVQLHEQLEDLLEKYELLVQLRLAPPGRTAARRDAMRTLAQRYPAALREWDSLPLTELQRRRAVVAAAAAQVRGSRQTTPPAWHAEPWLRYALDLHQRLRHLLLLRRQQAGPPGGLTATAYAEVAALHGVSVAEIKRALFQTNHAAPQE